MIFTSNKKIESHYDFIVVGAGAAGSVLAAELSASGAHVLVIESGGPDDAPTIANPNIWFHNVGGPLDYHLPAKPAPQLNNRAFNMALGHVLGGGSSINAMVWTRGMQRDYDGWARNGAKGWAFADVLPVFKRQEDWEGGANAWRGVGGPIHIRRPKDPHPTASAFLEAARQMGMPILDDVNGPDGPRGRLAGSRAGVRRRVQIQRQDAQSPRRNAVEAEAYLSSGPADSSSSDTDINLVLEQLPIA
jgi:choline dehydrogenase